MCREWKERGVGKEDQAKEKVMQKKGRADIAWLNWEENQGCCGRQERTPLSESESSLLPSVAETEQIEGGQRALVWHQWVLGTILEALSVIS